jgi:polyhydroxybutyrate depolymerase
MLAALRGLLAAVIAGCGLALSPAPARACPGLEPCRVEGGAYLALPPPGWDGVSRLPATIFFHGYGSSAAAVAGDPSFRAAFAREGVLLVLPDGLERTWAHTGSPSRARDEVAFMDAVRRDLLARFPVDPDGLLVTGFSQGGSMVWELACHRGGRFAAAYAPVAGAFWEPLPATCPGGPIDLRHVHGTADGTVPLAGRVIRGQFGSATSSADGRAAGDERLCCSVRPGVVEEAADGLRCEEWDGCAVGGRELRMCLHTGGHILPEGWSRPIQAGRAGCHLWKAQCTTIFVDVVLSR